MAALSGDLIAQIIAKEVSKALTVALAAHGINANQEKKVEVKGEAKDGGGPGGRAAARLEVTQGMMDNDGMIHELRVVKKELKDVQTSAPGWEQLEDPDGKKFYKHSSGKVTWTAPPEVREKETRVAELRTKLADLEQRRSTQVQTRLPWANNTGDENAAEVSNVLPTGIQMDKATLNRQQLGGALDAWKKKLDRISTSPRVSLTITFSPGFADVKAFRNRVEAMGVQILTESAAGLPPERKPHVPFADIAGDVHQPCLVITWRLTPDETTSVQWRAKRNLAVVKTRLGAIKGRIQLFLAFFGAVVEVEGAAPKARDRNKGTTEVNLMGHLPAAGSG